MLTNIDPAETFGEAANYLQISAGNQRPSFWIRILRDATRVAEISLRFGDSSFNLEDEGRTIVARFIRAFLELGLRQIPRSLCADFHLLYRPLDEYENIFPVVKCRFPSRPKYFHESNIDSLQKPTRENIESLLHFSPRVPPVLLTPCRDHNKKEVRRPANEGSGEPNHIDSLQNPEKKTKVS